MAERTLQRLQSVEDRPDSAIRRHEVAAITELAHDLVGRFELQPLLNRILQHAVQLLGCAAGSISLVDEPRGTYTKMVDFGVGCQEGQTFSLKEGVTGEVVRSRATVILDSYAKIRAGHIDADDPRAKGAVIGVPIRRESRIIGAFVIFSTDPGRLFTTSDASIAEMFANHAAIALANAEMHARAREREEDIAVARERERVHQEIHATIRRSLQGVTALLTESEAALAPSDDDTPRSTLVSQARVLAEETLHEAQRAINGFSANSLGPRSLQAALEDELTWIEKALGVETKLAVVGEARPIHPSVAHQLFRIGQEALSNVVSHARANNVRVGLVFRGESISLLVEDDGRGFDLEEVQANLEAHRDGCLGLQGMLNRAGRLGGGIDIETIPAWGTRIKAVIPDQPHRSRAGANGRRWKLIIATNQAILGAGLARLIQTNEPSVEVAAEVATPDQLFAACGLIDADVLLIDLAMLGSDPTSTLTQLRERHPDSSVVLLCDNPSVDQVRTTKSLGVRGFISAETPQETLTRVVIAAGQGQTLLEGGLYERLTEPSPFEDVLDKLTAREREVFPLVVQGLADKQIARQLEISVKTVEKHVGALLKKTGARNRTMLAGMFNERS
ncbi:MAG: GAF domain-containing protein [Nitriliruptoraceae bacterium]|nr:GAF domain-containing protein [Nitriliruptoraceae bacterium]